MSFNPPEPQPIQRIACTYAVATNTAAVGTPAFVVWTKQSGYGRVFLLYLTVGGHWRRRWESVSVLTDFRSVTVLPGSPEYRYLRDACDDTLLSAIQETWIALSL